MANAQVSGKVIDLRGNAIGKAEVWLFQAGGNQAHQQVGADGSFSFDVSDKDAWPAGDYLVRALPEGVAATQEEKVALPAAGSPAPMVIEAQAAGDASARAGWIFLAVASVALVLISWTYLRLHGVDWARLERRETIGTTTTKTLSEPFAATLAAAKQKAQTALAAAGGETSGATPAAPKPLEASGAAASIAAARTIFSGLRTSEVGLVPDDRFESIDALLTQAETALAAGDGEGLIAALDELEPQLEIQRTSFLWEENPGRLFEVLFWALIATLLRLIFNAGYYTYRGGFRQRAVPHHLALLVTIPIVAVLISFVLSLVRMTIALGETQLALDMSNVLISIVVAALIGLAPWKAWDFLCKLADLLFENLGNLVGKGSKPTGET